MPGLLVETIAFVFGLVALGYACGWTGLLATETGEHLTAFAVTVAVPLLLFRTMANADFGGTLPWALWAAYFSAAAIAWTIGQLVTVYVFGRDSRAGVVGGMATAFSNLVLLGIPFMLGVYGHAGVEILSLIVSIHLPIMIGTSILLFALVGGDGGEPLSATSLMRDFLQNLLSNPLIIGILAGLAWRATGLAMPALGVRFIDALANVAGPVALFAMGLGLRRYGISGNVRPALAIAALKLVFMPALALATSMLMGLPPASAKVVVMAAALPSGVNPFLMAARFGTGQALATNAMTVGTACAVATTAFWLVVAEWVYG